MYSRCKIRMVVAGKREQRKEQTRAQILHHALRLYRQRGFEATRVQDIIEEVGVSEKTFFNYFPSKQAILDAAGEQNTALYQALLRNELAQVERPVSSRLSGIVALWAETFTSDRDFLAVVATRTSFFFGSTGERRTQQRDGQLLLAELLRQGQETGEIRADQDPVQLAELLTACLTLTTVNWLDRWWDGRDEPLGHRLERALDVFLHGAASKASEPVRRRARSGP